MNTQTGKLVGNSQNARFSVNLKMNIQKKYEYFQPGRNLSADFSSIWTGEENFLKFL